MTARPRFHRGDLVEDTETGKPGTIVHVFDDPEIADEIIAVKFEGDRYPVAVPIDTLRRCRGGK
jgi:hypothetical protein